MVSISSPRGIHSIVFQNQMLNNISATVANAVEISDCSDPTGVVFPLLLVHTSRVAILYGVLSKPTAAVRVVARVFLR